MDDEYLWAKILGNLRQMVDPTTPNWTRKGVPGVIRGIVENLQRNPIPTVADFLPGVGDAKALAYDAPKEFGQGNMGMGALALASALPVVPNLAKAAGDAGVVARAADDAPKGIRAYHGSPHDFDEFSMDAIGTGEGAQAYGRG